MNFKKFLAATALAFVMPCLANAQEAEQAPEEKGWIFSEEVRLTCKNTVNGSWILNTICEIISP